MAKYSTTSFEKESCTIVIGGKKMTMSQYQQILKEKQSKDKKNNKKKKKQANEGDIVLFNVEKVIKPMTILKSFSAYYDNAYKQWGVIAKTILEHRKIRPHFVYYRIAVREMDNLLADIKKIAKSNETSIYQYVDKVTWKLDDIKTHLNNIIDGAIESGLMAQYKDKECINGKDKRLGLDTLSKKSLKAITQLDAAIKSLKAIADEGTNPLEYGTHMTAKTRTRLNIN